MLRQIFILLKQTQIYKQDFGKALDGESTINVFSRIFSEPPAVNEREEIKNYIFFNYRICYIYDIPRKLVACFVTDLTDRPEDIEPELIRCKNQFLVLFESMLDEDLDSDMLELFDPVVESIHKNLRPKVSLIGFSGVGKTTITNLIMEKKIPTQHVPTINGRISTLRMGKLAFSLWDFAGQEQFSHLWNNFIKGSDAVLLITDSSLENIEKSKFFLDLIKKNVPDAHAAVIGNKQDLPEAIPAADIERHLNLKAYSMVATDPDNRNKMITILGDILEISPEVSPLFKALQLRDQKEKEAKRALETGDMKTALNLFFELSDICIELGEDRISSDYMDKALKIKKTLKADGMGDDTAKISLPKTISLKSIKATDVQAVDSDTNLKLLQMIQDYKLKIANVDKKLTDFELANISEELSDEDFENKSARLEKLKTKLLAQLQTLSNA